MRIRGAALVVKVAMVVDVLSMVESGGESVTLKPK